MIKIQQISLIAVMAIGVGALLLPGTGLTQAAFAHNHHHHHNSGSVNAIQINNQENEGCSDTCVNVGINNINTGHQFSNNR
jgi:hypothetical protein